MSSEKAILLIAIAITGFTAYVFEVVIPFSDKIIQREKECKKAGGMIYEQKSTADLCIKQEIIIIK